jgi:hypothetical protein
MKFIVVYSNGTETERYLFNLENDVSETTNLVEQFPRLAGKLFAKLTKWEERVAAPRLNDFSAVYNP